MTRELANKTKMVSAAKFINHSTTVLAVGLNLHDTLAQTTVHKYLDDLEVVAVQDLVALSVPRDLRRGRAADLDHEVSG